MRSLALFGSLARNEAGPRSDVDLLVEIERPMGLFGLLRIQHFIEQLLGGTEVDLVMKGSVLEELKDDIMDTPSRCIRLDLGECDSPKIGRASCRERV